MSPFAEHLKCVGSSGESLDQVRRHIGGDPANAATACEIGTMQTPSFDAPADGLPAWSGLRRTTLR